MPDTTPIPTPGIGDNRPPADANPLLERLTEEHATLTSRRDELLDMNGRVPESWDDEEINKRASDFVALLRAEIKNADGLRVAEKAPYLAGERQVDAFFKGVSGPLDKARIAVLAKITTYQRKKDAEERKRLQEEARLAREEAERLAANAAEAQKTLESEADLDEAVAAEQTASQAEGDATKAARAAKAKPADLSRTRGDRGAVVSLHTFWDYDGLDREKIDLEALRPHLPIAAIEQALRAFVNAGGREIAGARIFENSESR